MRELCYSALDLAAIISTMDLSQKKELDLLNVIWAMERPFLDRKYRDNHRQLLLDTLYWMHYFYEKPILDVEFPAVQRDLSHNSLSMQQENYVSDFSDLDLFFKSMRIRILYGGGKEYVRMKLRTLLRQYGYQRRSPKLLAHINHCMLFYHLEATLKGGVECRIEDVGIDQMLTFRVIS